MELVLPIMTGVLAANLLTAMFLWGMSRAFKITDDRKLDRATFLALIMPLAFVVLGFLAANEGLGRAADRQVPQEDAIVLE